jgi:Zn-dependent protease with chaperone function
MDFRAVSEQFSGIYLDGVVNRKRRVKLIFDSKLEIVEDNHFIAAWPYDQMRRLPSAANIMLLHAENAAQLASLEILNHGAREEIERRCPMLQDDRPLQAGLSSPKLALLSLFAITMITGVIVLGPRLAANCLAPLAPLSWEKRLGETVEDDLHKSIKEKSCVSQKGMTSLTKLSKKLQEVSHLRISAPIEVWPSPRRNALALPGGKVIIFKGLLDAAVSQDEVLGLLAHEFGHVKNRDSLRRLIASSGSSYLLDKLFGDTVARGLFFTAGENLLNAANSRELETDADDFAAQILAKIGRPAKPMGDLLLRLDDTRINGWFNLLLDHPPSQDRFDRFAALDTNANSPPVLTDDEWKALKRICD